MTSAELILKQSFSSIHLWQLFMHCLLQYRQSFSHIQSECSVTITNDIMSVFSNYKKYLKGTMKRNKARFSILSNTI